MTRQDAREWVRRHFEEYILLADCGMDHPPEVAEIWNDETQRIADRITPRRRTGCANLSGEA